MWNSNQNSISLAAFNLLSASLGACVLFFAGAAWCQETANGKANRSTDDDPHVLKLELFVRGDSELCDQAISVAKEMCERRKGIELVVQDVVEHPQALERYWDLVKRYRVQKPVLPAFYACQRLKVGFRTVERDDAIAALFDVHAYVRSSCQHCRNARAFLTQLAKRWKGIRVIYHDVTSEPRARAEMQDIARRHGVAASSLPGIVICGRFIAGYRTDATTGKQLEQLLKDASVTQPGDEPGIDARPSDALASRKLNPQLAPVFALRFFADPATLSVIVLACDLPVPDAVAEDNTELRLPPESGDDAPVQDYYELPAEAPEGIEVPWIGFVSVGDWGLPLFTLLIGLVDGFNPCAMWVLVFLLSVLVNVKDRRKIAAIAGTFVLVSGVVYFAFMSAWLNLFMLIGIVRPLQVAIGLLALFIGIVNIKDFFAFKRGITLSIPESAKPGIYDRVRKIVTAKYLSVAIGLSVVLALIVNVVELLCTAGLPALYTQILAMQQLPAWKNYAYLGLYNLGYIFDDALMVIAFVATLSHQKLREAEGRWLKLISGCIVVALGLTVLFKPEWLQWGGG